MKKEDLKLGMKVRIKRDAKDIKSRLSLVEEMEKYLGKVVTITEIDRDGDIKVIYDNWYWDVNWLEPAEFDKKFITDGCRVTLDNGEQLIYFEDKDTFIDTEYGNDNCLEDLSDISKNGYVCDEIKIVKIEEPAYKTIYENNIEPKEMTLKEVCDALGYDVKIIKEED